jgi:hypothetical protein
MPFRAAPEGEMHVASGIGPMGNLVEQSHPMGLKTLLGAVNFAADLGGPMVGAMLNEKKRQEIARREAFLKSGQHPSQHPTAAKDFNDAPTDTNVGSANGNPVKVAPNLGDLR